MNRKGDVGIALIVVAALSFLALPFQIMPHRVRKATAKCIQTNTADYCKTFVAQLRKDGGLSGTKPSYIRDN